MIERGHWVLPYDTFGIPATKPPLYNWLSVPFVKVGGYQEWALKAPSVLGAAGALVVILLAGGHLARKAGNELPEAAHSLWSLGIVAAMFWLAVPVTMKLLYVARPDMLLVALLGGAWLAATVLLDRLASGDNRAAPFLPALAFWLCTLGAALDKGPLALFALIYLVLAALVIHRRPGILLKTGWWWGVPLVVGPMAAWSYAAYRQEPAFFEQVLLGRETANRVASPGRFFKTFFNGPAYLVTRFLPWSLLVIGALVFVGPRRWFKSALAPAILWLVIWFVVFSFASTKRPDRYAPVYPAMAIMAGYCALVLIPRLEGVRKFAHLHTPARWALPAALMALGLCAHNQFLSDPAKKRYGDHVAAFADAVRAKTGGEPVLFVDGEQTPLEALLGNVQADPPGEALLASARWVVRLHDPKREGAAAVSEPIDQVDGPAAGRLALYPVAPGEAARWYAESEAVPVLYVDDFNTVGTAAGARERWVQFWRLHSQAAGTQAGK